MSKSKKPDYKFVYFLGLILLLICNINIFSQNQLHEWKLFAYNFTDGEDRKWYYDTLSVVNNGDFSTCWVKKEILNKKNKEDYILYHFYISCNERVFCQKSKITFFRNGSTNNIDDECNILENIQPETIQEYLLKILCK